MRAILCSSAWFWSSSQRCRCRFHLRLDRAHLPGDSCCASSLLIVSLPVLTKYTVLAGMIPSLVSAPSPVSLLSSDNFKHRLHFTSSVATFLLSQVLSVPGLILQKIPQIFAPRLISCQSVCLASSRRSECHAPWMAPPLTSYSLLRLPA